MSAKREPMPDIEISEADTLAATDIFSDMQIARDEAEELGKDSDRWCMKVLTEQFARHRLAATAAERESLIKACEELRGALSTLGLWEHASGVDDAIEVIKQRNEATT